MSVVIVISDPMQWSIDNLKLPESSMRDNPEFQEILNQLKMAESQNWQIDEESKTNLAISLSQFMFKNQFNENPVKPRYRFHLPLTRLGPRIRDLVRRTLIKTRIHKCLFSGMRSDVEEDYGLVDQNGCEIDYIKLAQL